MLFQKYPDLKMPSLVILLIGIISLIFVPPVVQCLLNYLLNKKIHHQQVLNVIDALVLVTAKRGQARSSVIRFRQRASPYIVTEVTIVIVTQNK